MGRVPRRARPRARPASPHSPSPRARPPAGRQPAHSSPRRRRWRGAHAGPCASWLSAREPGESVRRPGAAAARADKLRGGSGPSGRLRPRVRARESRRSGRAPGSSCRAPGCRPPGVLSGSDREPGWRGRRDPPPRHAHAPARGRARARARRLRGPGARRATRAARAPVPRVARGAPLTLETPSRRPECPADAGIKASDVCEGCSRRRSGPVVRETVLAPRLTTVKKSRHPPTWPS